MIFKEINNNLEFCIQLTPGASRSDIVGVFWTDETQMALKISAHSRPVNNQANIELIQLISNLFKIAKTRIVIKHGSKSRNKIIQLLDYKITDIPKDLAKKIQTFQVPKHLFEQYK